MRKIFAGKIFNMSGVSGAAVPQPEDARVGARRVIVDILAY